MRNALTLVCSVVLTLALGRAGSQDVSPDRCDIIPSHRGAQRSLEEYNGRIHEAWHTHRGSVEAAQEQFLAALTGALDEVLEARKPDIIEVTTLLSVLFQSHREARPLDRIQRARR